MRLVFLSPVKRPAKNRQPDRTGIGCNRTAVAGFASYRHETVLVWHFGPDVKDRLKTGRNRSFLATVWRVRGVDWPVGSWMTLLKLEVALILATSSKLPFAHPPIQPPVLM